MLQYILLFRIQYIYFSQSSFFTKVLQARLWALHLKNNYHPEVVTAHNIINGKNLVTELWYSDTYTTAIKIASQYTNAMEMLILNGRIERNISKGVAV